MSQTDPTPSLAPAATLPRYPRGLYTLFFTEMWERFSYYGMRALLVLFMVDQVRHGGLGLSDEVATAIYGLYTAGVYMAALPGGWVADRLLGPQKAVWYGGIVIALGQFMLAIPSENTFYLGLIMVVLGTGLLKPNISVMVGRLYPEGGARRDAGFTLFYMGINLGAAMGPLFASWLGEKMNWHYGFAAAGVGMILGLVQYRLTARHLGNTGRPPETVSRTDWNLFRAGLAAVAIFTVLGLTGILPINPVLVARSTSSVIVGLAVVYFTVLFLFVGLNGTEKRRLGVIVILFIASAVFWSGFEQAGSSLNLFADRYTTRTFAGWVMPAGWFQIFNPLFIITLAPLAGWTWVALAQRRMNPSIPLKFAYGLLLLGFGFFLMVGASQLALKGHKVWPTWLIATYLFHSIGELCLSPVGLSSVTKLAPQRFVGQMMGMWFLATSLGNLFAGLMAGQMSGAAADQMPARFLQVVLTTSITGVILIVFVRPIKKWTAGVE